MKPKKRKNGQATTYTYQEYERDYEGIMQHRQENLSNYEKTITALSAAFLAFSVALLKFLESEGRPQRTELLVGSWVFFSAALFLLLANFVLSHMGYDSDLEDRAEAVEDSKFLESQRTTRWNNLALACLLLSGVVFVTGVCLLLGFSASNVDSF